MSPTVAVISVAGSGRTRASPEGPSLVVSEDVEVEGVYVVRKVVEGDRGRFKLTAREGVEVGWDRFLTVARGGGAVEGGRQEGKCEPEGLLLLELLVGPGLVDLEPPKPYLSRRHRGRSESQSQKDLMWPLTQPRSDKHLIFGQTIASWRPSGQRAHRNLSQ